MGFYIKDLYVDVASARRSTWRSLLHDPLTNPPTIPETSPAIAVAALSPVLEQAAGRLRAGDLHGVEEVARGIGIAALSVYLPADDGELPPSRISPIAVYADGLLDEADLLAARDTLRVALDKVDRLTEGLQPDRAQLEHLRDALEGALPARASIPAQG